MLFRGIDELCVEVVGVPSKKPSTSHICFFSTARLVASSGWSYPCPSAMRATTATRSFSVASPHCVRSKPSEVLFWWKYLSKFASQRSSVDIQLARTSCVSLNGIRATAICQSGHCRRPAMSLDNIAPIRHRHGEFHGVLQNVHTHSCLGVTQSPIEDCHA